MTAAGPPLSDDQTSSRSELASRLCICLVAGSGAGAATVVALVFASSDRALALALVLTQTLGVLWLGRLGYRRGGHWSTATFVTAAAWAALFLMPCWIYAVDPGLLKTTTAPAQAIALVDLSLFATIGGLLIARALRGAPVPPELVQVENAREPSPRALVGFGALGVVCLVVLMARNGGPIEYITNQYRSGQLNRGLMYLVWGVLFLRYVPLTAVASRWSRGAPAGRAMSAYLIIGSTVVAVMGARAFLASAAIQVLLVAVLLRRRLRVRTVAGPALVLGVVLVFGLGAVKFYQAYNADHHNRRLSLVSYLLQVAPGKTLDAYANNYASGVSLIGQARRIVPAEAGYEYGKVLLRLALKPIPSPYRPKVGEARPIREAFDPIGGYANAVPLQATAYLQLGLPGIVVVFLAFGALLAMVDRGLARARQSSLASLLPLIALAVQIPILLRGGIPAGLVFLLIDVIGMWLVAITVVGGPGSLRERALRGVGRASP